MSTPPADDASGWAGAWIDLAAFAGGLALAWFAKWTTTDLVWSLWLSSLVVGYALIVWTLTGTLREFAWKAARDRRPGAGWAKLGVGAALGAGLLFMLAFFTVHFGGFHLGHSVFLQVFFPIEVNGQVSRDVPNFALYAQVLREYWLFVPIAFLAEREAFLPKRSEAAHTAVTPEAIKRRQNAVGGSMMAPYKNVVRMHLLIFFFAAAHFLRLENLAIYAVVYAVYFFPWRLVRRREKERELSRV